MQYFRIMYVNQDFHDENLKEGIPLRQKSIPVLPYFSFLLQSSLLFCSCFQGENENFHTDQASYEEKL